MQTLLGLVDVPTELQADRTAAWVFTALFGGGSVLWTLWYFYKGAKVRDFLPVFAALGGACAALVEPSLDRLGFIHYPSNSPWILYDGYDNPQPSYLMMGAIAYIGVGSYWVADLLRTKGRNFIWTLFVILAVLEGVGEIAGTAFNVWMYYGPQPMQVNPPNGLPLYWAAVNGVFPIAGGWMLFHLLPRLTPVWKAAVTVSVPPMVYGGIYLGTCWPVWLTINSGSPAGIRWLAAAGTIGMCIVLVKAMQVLMPAPDAADTEDVFAVTPAERGGLRPEPTPVA